MTPTWLAQAIDLRDAEAIGLFPGDENKALALIGAGMRLRIPHDGSSPAIVEGLSDAVPWRGTSSSRNVRRPVLVSVPLANILRSRLCKIAKDRVGQRAGWKETGYDGEVADWYCHIQ